MNNKEHDRTLRYNPCVEQALRRFGAWSSTVRRGPFGTGIGGVLWTQGQAEVRSSCLVKLGSRSQTDAGRRGESPGNHGRLPGDNFGFFAVFSGMGGNRVPSRPLISP